MNNAYKIENNVPLHNGSHPRTTQLRKTIEKLKVGQSFLVPASERKAASNATDNTRRNTGKEFTMRAEGKTGSRIWRTK